jgi:ATP-dependent Lon protease
VVVEDLFIRAPRQIQNFVRFCEAVVKHSAVRKNHLIAGFDDSTPLADVEEKLNDLKQSLLEMDVVLGVDVNPNMHDREIRIDIGWVVKIGRGLHLYEKPDSWYSIGATDLALRKCLDTKVDIFRQGDRGDGAAFSRPTSCVFLESTECVRQPHMLGRPAVRREQQGTRDDYAKALRA